MVPTEFIQIRLQAFRQFHSHLRRHAKEKDEEVHVHFGEALFDHPLAGLRSRKYQAIPEFGFGITEVPTDATAAPLNRMGPLHQR